MFTPIYFFFLHSFVNACWVVSCMSRCCVLFGLSGAAFCTVQSFPGGTFSLKDTEVHLSQGFLLFSVDGRGIMTHITVDMKAVITKNKRTSPYMALKVRT